MRTPSLKHIGDRKPLQINHQGFIGSCLQESKPIEPSKSYSSRVVRTRRSLVLRYPCLPYGGVEYKVKVKSFGTATSDRLIVDSFLSHGSNSFTSKSCQPEFSCRTMRQKQSMLPYAGRSLGTWARHLLQFYQALLYLR